MVVVLRAYLDSSGDPDGKYLTLAAFAGPDHIWQGFDVEWAKILSGHTPPMSYLHMRELAHLKDGFSGPGWNKQTAFGLVFKCLMYMQHLDKKKFRMFYCTVDIDAWRKLNAETYQLPDPIEMCNEFCSEKVLDWYFVKHPGLIGPNAVHYLFDRNEPFRARFEAKWKQEKRRHSRADEIDRMCRWDLIGDVESAEMKKTTGLQAADILAWSVNRKKTASGDVPGAGLSEIMGNIIPSLYQIWDEAEMRKTYRPLIFKP